MKRSPLPTRQQRKLDLFFAMARMLKPDAQGRVVLPEKSMQRAVIAKNVTLVGKMDHVEIVPTDEWEQRLEQDLPSYGEVLDGVAELMEQAGDEPEGHGE
jgi:DNA-binding transcriptional regulator/RsmH inhibitor MraZ